MGFLRQIIGGARVLANRAERDREIGEELEHFFAETVAAHRARGLSAEDAWRAARRDLGNPLATRETVRSSGWEHAVEETLADLRIAGRRLRAAPGFATLAVLTLALGLGATTAIWSVVSPILLQALPYPQAPRLMMVWEAGGDGRRIDGTFGAFTALAERGRPFESLAVMRPWQPALIEGGEPERLEGQRVSARYFEVLGVRPALGRGFEPGDDHPAAARTALLSDALWRRRFGADPAVVGRTITLDGTSVTVIGVLPASFENVLAPAARIWTPLGYDLTLPQAWGHHLRTVGRLRAGLEIDAARGELAAFSRDLQRRHPREVALGGLLLEPLQADLTRAVKPALLAVLGAVLLVLLIACANVTHLLLGRAVERRGELAVRAALGAGRRRILRQLLTESLVLAGLGGAAGLAVAAAGLRALLALRPPGLPRAEAIVLDARVFAFGLAVTTLVGLACGLLPALVATRVAPAAALGGGSRRVAGGHRRARRVLVVAEVALALMLLIGSGLLLRSLARLFAVEPGFDPRRLLTLQLETRGARFPDDGARRRFFAQALEGIRALPGVESAALTSQLPLSGDDDVYGVHFESASSPESSLDQGAFRYAVSPGYLETLRIPLVAGRALAATDGEAAPGAILLGASFARRRFPGGALGERLHVGPADGPWYTVVGVVADVKQQSLAARAADAVYVPAVQWPWADDVLSLVVRARADAAGGALGLLPAVRAAIRTVDPNQAVSRVATMEQLMVSLAAERRFVLALFEVFAVLALGLAAIGVYGVLAASVAERRRELAVRTALGAPRADLLAMVVGQGMRLTALGALLGVLGAAAGSRALVALLFDVSRLDPLTYVAVAALVLTVSAVACLAPAWRAAGIDPAEALRAD